jgi:ATP-dependent Clp endopeptidase proteolytic subunit ClpP
MTQPVRTYRRSTKCDSGRCVEVADSGDGDVYVRDTFADELDVERSAWRMFVEWIKSEPLIVNGPTIDVERPQWMIRGQDRIADNVTVQRDWFRIVNATGDGGTPAELYLYDEIGFWGTSAADFVDQLKGITAGSIDLHVNSPGGEVFDGIAIYNAIKNHPASVTTYVDGLAASAASFITMAGDRIVMARNAQMMIHDAIGVVIGNAAEMEKMRTLLDRLSDNIADIYAQRAGGDVADWRKLMLDETWFDATEAVGYGLADEMSGTPAADDDASDVVDQWNLAIFAHAGRANAPAPKPINRTPPTPIPDATPPEDQPTDDWSSVIGGLLSAQTDDPFAGLWR